MRIDFLGLEAFLNIAEMGSFQAAASRLNLSQTALSHRMRKLEQALGLPLLLRTTRQVILTPAGLEFLPKARRMVDELAGAFQELRDRGREQQERVAIGCLPSIAVNHLPRVLRRFTELHPQISVKIHDNSAREIAQLVQSGAAEFGITMMSIAGWDMEIKTLFKEPFILLCPADHRFAGQDSVEWADLAGIELIRISPQAANRNLIDSALGSRSEMLRWRYEVQHLATAVSMVQAGLALTVVPRLAVDLVTIPGLVGVALRNPSISRSLGVIAKRGLPLSAPSQTLLDMIVKDLKEQRPGGRLPKAHPRAKAGAA